MNSYNEQNQKKQRIYRFPVAAKILNFGKHMLQVLVEGKSQGAKDMNLILMQEPH